MSKIRFQELTRLTRTAVALATLTVAALPQAQAVGVSGQGTWQTTLQGRDLDGNSANGFEAYYDTDLNITWLADANFAKTSGYDADGLMDWDAAKAWADNLVVGAYSNWRLPTMVDIGTPGCDASSNAPYNGTDCGLNVSTGTSEMAHMFYVTLGNKAYSNSWGGFQSDGGLTNTGSFSNVLAGQYWFGVEYAPVTRLAWVFLADNGYQSATSKDSFSSYAWAVRTGDIAFARAVPEPESYALALVSLAAIGFTARRLKKA